MALVVFLLYSIVLAAAVFRPKLFVYTVFLIAPFPFGAIMRNPVVATPLGLLHVNSLVVLAILLASVIGLAVNMQRVVRHARLVSVLLVFVGFALVSMTWADDISMSIRMLLKIIAPIAFMLLIAATASRIGQKALMGAVVASGVFYTLATIASWALNLVPSEGFALPVTSRAVTTGHLLAPLAVAISQLTVETSAPRIVLAALFLVGVVAGFTRITITGALGESAVVLFVKSKGPIKLIVPVVALLAFIALFTVFDTFRSRMFLEKADRMSFESVIDDPGGAIGAIAGSGRYAAWDLALRRLFIPHPVFGSGIGAAQHLFYDPIGVKTSATHSEVVRLLCDLGVAGLALFILGWTQILRGLYRRYRRGHLPVLSLAALTSAIGYLIFALTDNGFDYVGQMGVFTYGLAGGALGMTVGLVPKAPQRAAPQAEHADSEEDIEVQVADFASPHQRTDTWP